MPDDRFLHKRAGHSEKVNLLTDLEYRVWTQYLLSADDFGVMRGGHHQLQADNDRLANRPAKVIQRCLEALTRPGGLLRTFTHQGRPYVYQHDWQTWQKVEYPRGTTNPKPPTDGLEQCDPPTRKLFDMHPGGGGRKRPKDSPNVPQTVPEDSPPMRAGAPAKRLTANGQRLTANGSEGEAPPLDVWLRELQGCYPAKAVTSGHLTETAFCDQVLGQCDPPRFTYELMLANLETQKAGAQWAKGMIPRLDRWLREGLWTQRHEPAAASVDPKRPAWAQPKPAVNS